MSPHAFAPARRGRSRGRTYRWWCCFTPCGMSSMKVMVGGAESASVTRTSGVCPGSLSRALKVPLSSPSFWQCILISRAWRTLQASWPDRSRHCARPRGCRPMIVEDTKPGTARPRRSLRVSHTRVAHASGSLRPTRAPRNLCMKSGCFDRPDRKIFSLRGPTMVGRAASRPEVGPGRFSKYSMFLRHLLGFRVHRRRARTLIADSMIAELQFDCKCYI